MEMNKEYDVVWNNFISLLKNRIAIVSINSWFKNCSIYEIKDESIDDKTIKNITIQTSSLYIKEALKKRYLDIIEELMENVLGKQCLINFILTEEIQKEKENVDKSDYSTEQSTTVDKNDVINTEPVFYINHNILEKYTFDNFIIGESNRLAHTASMSVAEQPGRLYNPFFIHGKSGLGKTHLMHAIGNYILNNTNKKVLYVTSEQFITDFTNINMKKSTDYIQEFKNKYRNIDVLMIDDIQFLEGADKTQREFFHTFNNLYDLNKQIIISSDRSPDDLKLLEERLRTRFSWGLTVNIYPPELELKKKIVKNKLKGQALANMVSDDVIEYIASNSENDVRHIEGAVTRLYAYSAIMNQQVIDLKFANEALKDYLKKSMYMDSNIAKIQKAVADYYNITVKDLKSKKRSANINYPRQIAIYMCRNYTNESFPKIGLEFGNRNHSTIIHACDKIKNDLKENNTLAEVIKNIKDNIN